MTDAATRDRAMGAWIGLAVGDALGTTLEFRPRDTYEPLTDMVGGGPFGLEPGEWTDDASMAWALAASLAAHPGFDPHDLMERFLAWRDRGEYASNGRCFDIGSTVAAALRAFEATGDPFRGPTGEYDAGNGSLMRLSPVALWGLGHEKDEVRRVAREQSRTTHGATACLDACEAFAVILCDTIGGSAKADVLDAAGRTHATGEIGAVLDGQWRGKARVDIHASGYVAHTLEATLWCVARTDDFRSAVLMAANLGEDADTTAAVTGQLAGALYGLAAIPAEWIDRLARRHELVAVAERLLKDRG